MPSANAPQVTNREKDAPEVTSGEMRSSLKWGILLGLLAMGLSIVAALLISPKGAQGHPKSSGGCTVELTGSTVLLFIDQAELTFTCDGFGTTNRVTQLVLTSDNDGDNTPDDNDKGFLAVDQQNYLCIPGPPGADLQPRINTCTNTPLNPTGQTSGSFTILTNDACGDQDGTPLTLDVALTGGGTVPTTVTIQDLEIQCEEGTGTGTTTTGTGTTGTGTGTTTTGTGTTGTTTTGPGTTSGTCHCAGRDNGSFPSGGVQSGAGGTA